MSKFHYWDMTKMCAAIHGVYTGSGDTLELWELQDCVRFLKQRQVDWYKGEEKGRVYDEAMRAVLLAAIAEGEEMLKENKPAEPTDLRYSTMYPIIPH